MGWISNDNLHEAYLEALFVDGATSSATNGSGPLAWSHDSAGELGYEQRSYDEVVGWRLRCDCYTEGTSHVDTTWEGSTFQRAATAATEDLENGRIFVAPGEASTDVSDREDVETIVMARWLSEHVSPLEALDTISTSQSEIAAATQRLDQAVAYARSSGQTWDKIGRAAGMSRQAAQARWGSRTN